MYWLDNDSGVTTPPAIPPVASATRKWFTEGGAGEQPSWPGGEWFNMMTDEMLAVLALAGITPDKADHAQLAKAIQSIAFSAAPVGSPLPWPLAMPPAGFLLMNGQTFNPATHPKLALAYPSGTLPDLRGEFIRGWDNGRGIDPGRTLLSAQGDAIRNMAGSIAAAGEGAGVGVFHAATGVFTLQAEVASALPVLSPGAAGTRRQGVSFSASSQVPTASEARPHNFTFNYIVRAA